MPPMPPPPSTGQQIGGMAGQLGGMYVGGKTAGLLGGLGGGSAGAGAVAPVASAAPSFAAPSMMLPGVGGSAASGGAAAASTGGAAAAPGMSFASAALPLAALATAPIWMPKATGLLNKGAKRLFGDKEANRVFRAPEAAQSTKIGGQIPGYDFGGSSQAQKESFVSKLNELGALSLPGREENGKLIKGLGTEHINIPAYANRFATDSHFSESYVPKLRWARPTLDEMEKVIGPHNEKAMAQIAAVREAAKGLLGGLPGTEATGLRPAGADAIAALGAALSRPGLEERLPFGRR